MRDFNCDDCRIKYTYNHTLKKHLSEKHNIQNINAKTNMTRHMKTLHSEIMSEANDLSSKSVVPDGYDYTVIEYTSLGEEQFIAKFDINSFGVDNINSWLLTMREKKNSKSSEIIYKKRFRCHHNTRPKIGTTPSQKHYNCKATLGLKIIKDLRNDKVGNHEILRAEVFKHRIPSDEVKSKILKLFEEGKTPSKALFAFKSQLKVERAHGNDMMVSLNEAIEEYNTECKSKTNSCAGGLPVGTIILTSESTSVISVGLELWKSLFPLDALGGRGLVGPNIFMSDDSTAERNALHEAFPQSELLLYYRQTLYLEIKNMVYSKDKDELETTYNDALQKPVVLQTLNLDSPSKIENSNTNKLDIIQTNKINTATMNSNNQSSYQDTDTSKSIQLIEENRPKNLLETPPAEDFENAMTNFNEVIEKIKRAFASDKEYFLPSMKSFVNSFQTNVRTHASLNSALQTFGKYSGLNPNSKKPKLMGTKPIGVQPTTRARRKTEIGGRRNLAAGRNPK
ncbi:SWIM-type domain-containing protein [Aphis craccivora]|uniref:SWIM-type domain-containing protein n=1 Tax=Aphis craccivora TaxID=307492 RepID=A0A6G0W4J3_APHCR|nr:SWIM-type domain-containing protein [Aphis craccivora]